MSAVFGPTFWTVPGRSIPMFANVGNHGLSRSDAACVTPPSQSVCHPHIQNWPQPTAVATSAGSYKVDTYAPTTYGTTQANLPSLWYAFDAGVARIYMLETAWPDNNVGTAPAPGGYANDYQTHWKPGTPEYDWLKADLAAHPGGVKFAVFHKPLVSDTSSKNEASDTWLRSDGPAGNQSLEALLATNGVAMAFNGHAHTYQRNAARVGGNPSLISYVTGGGGAPSESLTGLASNCSPEDKYAIAWSPSGGTGSSCPPGQHVPTSAAQVFHFLKVTVNGTIITVAPTNSLGATFDVQTYNVGSAASSGFTVDGFGGLQPFSVGGAPPLAKPTGGPYWGATGFDIARGVALLPDKTGGYVLDGWGGLHPFGIGSNLAPPKPTGGPYWVNQDIAKGVSINPDGKGGYIVDGLGGLHGFAIGSNPVPPKPVDGPWWPTMNIARGVAMRVGGGGYVVDGFGGFHPFTANGSKAPPAVNGPYWIGQDIVRGVTTTTDGAAGYLADLHGGIQTFDIWKKASAVTASTGWWPAWDIARGIGL
jgi:hypothetical protein